MFLLSNTVPHRENCHKFWFFSQVSGLLANMRNGPLALSAVRLDTIDGCLASYAVSHQDGFYQAGVTLLCRMTLNSDLP